jgi:hypothetical protein
MFSERTLVLGSLATPAPSGRFEPSGALAFSGGAVGAGLSFGLLAMRVL